MSPSISSDEIPLKMASLNFIDVFGNVIFLSAKQFKKHFLSINVTDGGISISLSEQHPLNDSSPIVVNDEFCSKITLFNDVHFSNAFAPIFVTVCGISISVIEEHSLKVFSSIIVKLNKCVKGFNSKHLLYS